jgi:hypothetical protein
LDELIFLASPLPAGDKLPGYGQQDEAWYADNQRPHPASSEHFYSPDSHNLENP